MQCLNCPHNCLPHTVFIHFLLLFVPGPAAGSGLRFSGLLEGFIQTGLFPWGVLNRGALRLDTELLQWWQRWGNGVRERCFQHRWREGAGWVHIYEIKNSQLLSNMTIKLFVLKTNVDICCKWTHHHPEPPRQTGNCHQTCSDLRKDVKLSASFSNPRTSLIHYNGWPEGGSSAHHWFGSVTRWCTVSCTCFCFCAGTKPPAVVSLSFPPSWTAAAGFSSVVYWGAPPGRVCGPLHRSADAQPSRFPVFAALHPVKESSVIKTFWKK